MEEKRQAHVRPKVRSKRAVVAPSSLNDIPDKTDMDELLEHTRQRIQSQLEISSTRKHVGKQAASSISQVAPPTSAPLKAPTAKPKKGILKTSKYSVQLNETSTKDTNVNVNDSSRPLVKEKPRAAVKDLVVERQEPATNEPAALFADAMAVEGHTPSRLESNTPLVVSSISQILSQGGTQQQDSNSRASPPQVVEADLSFACMTSQEYDETVKCAAESMELNLDADTAGGPDNNTNKHELFDQEDDDSFDNEEDDMSDDEHESSSLEEGDDSAHKQPEPRAFMKLWEAITDWATPETISLLHQWRRENDAMDCSETESVPQVDQSDLGSSRRKGLNSMLTMYLPSTLSNLGQQDDRRRVEMRLDNLLRTLSFKKPMAKLNPNLWKAMTCVLVDMVLLDSMQPTNVIVPAPASEVGMVADEYKYLIRSAVTNLEAS